RHGEIMIHRHAEVSDGLPLLAKGSVSYKLVLDKWVRPRWEAYRVREFERPAVRAAVKDWLRSLGLSPNNPKGLAPKTVRSIWNVMKLTFKFGVKWGYLNENPLGEKRVELPRGSTKRTKHSVQLTAAEFFRLLSQVDSREKLAVAFAGGSGRASARYSACSGRISI
ncbi:MAG TPA: hypothetical protein VF730_07265, partial [Terracidiphilus sp.]